VVVEGHSGEVGVRKLEVRDVGAVDLELELVRIRQDREVGRIRRGQVLHWVIEVHLLDLGARGDRLLDLGHDHVLGLRSEDLPLLGIEVRVVCVNVPLVRSRRRTPGNAELNVVVLEGNEGEGRLPVLTEGEAEGVETGGSRTTKEVARDGLGGGGRRKGWRDEGRVGRVLLVHNLATDEQFNLGNLGAPLGGGVGLGRRAIVGDEVDVAHEVPLPLEADGGHTIVRDVALDDLTLDSLGEVGVTLVGRSEKADLWLANEVDILSTDGNELGNTTRHFIL